MEGALAGHSTGAVMSEGAGFDSIANFEKQDGSLSKYHALSVLEKEGICKLDELPFTCLLYTSPSPRDRSLSRMPSSA